MTHDPNREAWFDTWLDAKLSGKPPPPIDPDGFGADELLSLQGATDGAGQFHALASHAERRDHGQSEQDQIWNRVLEDRANRPTPFRASRRFRPGWSAVISTLVAAVVLLAIVAGFRKFDFGEETGDPEVQFGASGSEVISDANLGSLADYSCDVEPISRQVLLDALATPPGDPVPRVMEVIPTDQASLNNNEIDPLISTATLFYTCLLEGKPMSALSMTTTVFKKDWVRSQIAFTYGVFSDEEVEAYVDSLVEKENRSREEGFAPLGTTFFAPEFQNTNWVQTADGRIHLVSIWPTSGDQAELKTYLSSPPDYVVFARQETGDWLVDRIGSDIFEVGE